MPPETPILNYINGKWRPAEASEWLEVINPATAELLGRTPFSTAADVEAAAQAALQAFSGWRRTPAQDRIQYLLRLRDLMKKQIDDLSRTITMECGKTFEESKAELQRAVENIEVASGVPILSQGVISEDIAPGIDEIMIRQPVGACAAICPFNFPGMIPFWFMPYALACGNTYIVKPSEKVPLTMQKIFQMVEEAGFPPGVVNLVNGSKEAVDAILHHPAIRAISFVGSTPVAKYIYATGAASGKRVQAQGGAKNPVVVLPDAEMEMAVRITADSSFGCAGQRCLATSLAITVGEARGEFTERICEAAATRVVGYGLEPGVQMGPVISMQSKLRIEQLIAKAQQEGASLPVDGRSPRITNYERGSFVAPTILDNLPPGGEIAHTEIFGPALGLMHVDTIDEAIALVNSGSYGNQASLFTTSGNNIGIAAPMAFFPFSGWRESFFGDLHGQGMDAVEFFTQKKVVIERWPQDWTRKF
jgi:malonate-semialdehyde dehydrogenase (acetylating)/methylmalonate-semialdehyde dehydrogenase